MSWFKKLSWLSVYADKASFLYQKYLPMALKRLLPGFSEDKVKKMYQHQVEQAMSFSKKYAEWYLYQTLVNSRTEIMFPGAKNRQVLDYLERGDGGIPSIKTTPEEVISLSDAWHDKMREKMMGPAAKYKTNNIVAELSNGYRLVSVPAKDAKAEGANMGHCVGRYCQDIQNDNMRIFSIRDANNNPRITIEAIPDVRDPRTYESGDQSKLEFPYLAIQQIKGQEDKPQPQYAPQIEEVLDALMKIIPVTMNNEGWVDYTETQKDENIANQRVQRMVDGQPDWVEHGDVFKIYQYAKVMPNNEKLLEHIQENLEGLEELVDWNSMSFWEYIAENNKDELAYRAEELLDSGDITQEEHDDYIVNPMASDNEKLNAILPGLMEILSSDREFAKDFYPHYLLENHADEVIKSFINTEFDETEEASDYHDDWVRYFNKQRREERIINHKERLQRILTENNIVIPEDIYDNVMRWIGPDGPLLLEYPDERWLSHINQVLQRQFNQRQYDYQAQYPGEAVAGSVSWLQHIILAQLRDEVFIDDSGFVYGADGDIGPEDHDSTVMSTVLGVLDDFDNLEILEVGQLSEEQMKVVEENYPGFVEYVFTGGLPKEYAVLHMGWVRVLGSNFEAGTINENILQNIVNYAHESGATPETELHINERSTGDYPSIPFGQLSNAIDQGQGMALFQMISNRPSGLY